MMKLLEDPIIRLKMASSAHPNWQFMRRLFLLFLCTGIVCSTQAQNPDLDVQHYAFHLSLTDASNEIAGEATIEVVFQRDGVGAVDLNLIGQQGASGGNGMRVASVTEEGRAVTFTHDADRLRIQTATPSQAEDRRTYVVTYSGIPADGLVISQNKYGDRTFFGDNWPNRARNWLPAVDHPSDKATVEFLVTAPDHYRVVANGELVEETDLPDALRLTHWRSVAPLPTKVMVIGVARFAVQHVDDVDGIPVQSWVYPQDREAGFYDFARAEPILAFFNGHLGPYPYAKLANVQSKTRFGGMENAGAIFYSENAINGTRSNEPLLAHEIAHQWFGDSVTEEDWPHIWLSEGFATYLTQLYLEFTYGRDRLVQGMQATRQTVLDYSENAPEGRVVDTETTDLMGLLNPNSYQKGGWVLHMLRYVVGDEAFWDGLRAYYRQYRDQNADTHDFQQVMETVSGQDLAWFFTQWLTRPGQPDFEGSWRYDAAAKQVVLTLQQTQEGTPFRLSLEVGLYAEQGAAPHIEVVEVTEQAHTFTLPSDTAPVEVVLDPNTWLLMRADIREGG